MINIGVLGTGTMGPQIAVALSAAGYHVALYNHLEVEKAAPKLLRLAKVFAKRHSESSMGPDLLIDRISLIPDLEALADVSIVIEAVVENLPVKQQLFAELDRICEAATILASNTSSLPVDEIGQGVKDKTRLIGLHFFNPVFETNLVEVLSTPASSAKCVEEALALVDSLQKVPMLFPESCVNRLLIPMINEACHALEQGLGRAEEIDRAMRSGANHPMGPFSLADLIGLDVVVAILKSLERRLGSRYQPAHTLYALVEQGRLGRKAGRGFFTYGKSKTTDLNKQPAG